MKNRQYMTIFGAFLAIVLSFSLGVNGVFAYCASASVFETNVTNNFGGSIVYQSQNFTCPYGCDTSRGICKQGYFGTPAEFYIFFEAIAFLLLLGSVVYFQRQKGDAPVMIPILSTVMFFILAYLGGTVMYGGNVVTIPLLIWVNFGMAALSLLMSVVTYTGETMKSISEYDKRSGG